MTAEQQGAGSKIDGGQIYEVIFRSYHVGRWWPRKSDTELTSQLVPFGHAIIRRTGTPFGWKLCVSGRD